MDPHFQSTLTSSAKENYLEIANYIDGEWIKPVSGQYIDNYEPATGKIYSLIPDSDERDVNLAVEAARKAFPSWSKIGIRERQRLLLAISDRIGERLTEFAEAESRDSGKTVHAATTVDIPRAQANFAFFANAIQHFSSEAHGVEGTGINFTIRQPIGVVGCISPWNLPLYLFTWKIAPALAAGNTVVAKPSELTPFTAFLLSDICREIGLPAGVLNIVHGLGAKAGQHIVEHPHTKAISFTGGTSTGRILARTAAPMFKKLSLELGGKNPALVFNDAYAHTVDELMRAAFSNNGQICLCGSRFYVQKERYEAVKNELVRRTNLLKTGNPTDRNNQLGALVSKAHLEKVQGYIKLAIEEGGRLLCGGEVIEVPGFEGGYYMRPAIIEGLPIECRTNQEEIFGPVITLSSFETEEEALALANGTDYGLAATLWTADISRAHRMAEQLQFGIVWVNCWMERDLRTPFGGVKNSGVGREGGWEALRFFTEAKNVYVKYG